MHQTMVVAIKMARFDLVRTRIIVTAKKYVICPFGARDNVLKFTEKNTKHDQTQS